MDTRKKNKAFTLIELLVVVAILSLLVSILMPSLRKALDLTRQVVCSSNLRSIAAVSLLYSQDSDDRFPPAHHIYSPPFGLWRWPTILGPYLYPDNTMAEVQSRINRNKGTIFYCPAQLDNTHYNASYGINGQGVYTTPPPNVQADQPEVGVTKIKTDWFCSADRTFSYADSHWNDANGYRLYAQWSATWGNFYLGSTRHQGPVNFAYVDGHAGAVNYDLIPTHRAATAAGGEVDDVFWDYRGYYPG